MYNPDMLKNDKDFHCFCKAVPKAKNTPKLIKRCAMGPFQDRLAKNSENPWCFLIVLRIGMRKTYSKWFQDHPNPFLRILCKMQLLAQKVYFSVKMHVWTQKLYLASKSINIPLLPALFSQWTAKNAKM